MRTIPMRARKSNSSKPEWSDKGLGPSLRHIQRTNRWEQMRYVFSISLFAISITGLAVGSIGGVTQEASARDNSSNSFWSRLSERLENSRGRDNESSQLTNRTQNTPQQTQQVAPSQPTPAQTPAEPVAPAAPATPVVTPQIVPSSATPEAPVAPVVEDTAPQIATMAAAQADAQKSTPVTYTSHQISTETRNRLLALAIAAATSGALIFVMSLFGTGSMNLRSAAARVRIPVREVTSS